MQPVLLTDNLTKRYGNIAAVDRIRLRIEEGEVYGFLGPNGAGKTTTLKMLVGLIQPTEGTFTVFGRTFAQHRRWILSQTGALIESPSYYGHLTGRENLRIIQRLRGLPEGNVSEVLRVVRLEKQQHKRVDQYSLGMKQRLGLAMALISFPKLLILDEPTNGLDPAGIEEIRELIRSLPRQYGMTVLVSSHLLSEVEQIATSVGIIRDGRLVFQGSLDSLKAKSDPAIAVKTTDNLAAEWVLAGQGLKPKERGGYLTLPDMEDRQVAEVNRTLVRAGIGVIRIEERKKILERIFLELTGKGDHR
ncbi:ABC-2 type transport system ATP-binding protein [Planifilum fimeticola]|uniref:ABC-2 type transport system ATP-binding protein n=1 Tax=Planifilum fimeticola TaxID=201975 RepID=A0A2T0LJS6_9BACL|nr:ABC transporter ATP-binding protein [Planifilum fimeticola]PRX42789.1 ABC-2 type transport system ATP-binding protein [Planifilum fimeticola]